MAALQEYMNTVAHIRVEALGGIVPASMRELYKLASRSRGTARMIVLGTVARELRG